MEAAYWRPEVPRPPMEEALARPDLAKLLAGWGRMGDTGFVATEADRSVGAAWYRLWTEADHSYGFVSPEIPEVAIGVIASHRGRGIGRQLIRELIAEARSQQLPALSLSVEQENRAAALYISEGFAPVATVGNAWTMLIRPG